MNAAESPTECSSMTGVFTLTIAAVAVISEFLPALKLLVGHDDDEISDLSQDELEDIGVGDIEISIDCASDLWRRISKGRGVLHILLQILRCQYVQKVTGVDINTMLKDFRECCGLLRTPKHVKKTRVGKCKFYSTRGSSDSDDSASSLDSTPPSSTEEEEKSNSS